MKQITLRLDATQQRPVVLLGNGMRALLDTGAYIPVWLGDESIISEDLGGELIQKDFEFSGFGGKAKGNLYKMTVQIGDLIYPNMTIIANNDLELPFHLILSATMFQRLRYEIDDGNHMLNITVPDTESVVRNLKVVSKDGETFVLCENVFEA